MPESSKPLKRSVAVAIFPPEEREPPRVLAVLRPPDDELPDVWGLPAASLREEESWEDAVRRAGREKLALDLRVGPELERGEADRPAYRLRMRLYAGEIEAGEPDVEPDLEPDVEPDGAADEGEIRPGTTRYVDWAWAPLERLREGSARGSLCSRLLLRHLGRDAVPDAGPRP